MGCGMRAPNMLVPKWRRGKRCSKWKSLISQVGENADAAATLVQLTEVWHRAMWFKFVQKVLRVLRAYFAHERRFHYEDASYFTPIKIVGTGVEDGHAGCNDKSLVKSTLSRGSGFMWAISRFMPEP